MELNEKTLSSQLVYDGQLLKVYYDTVELVDGNTSWREVIRHPGAVVVVPIDSQGNVHMVRQFRYPYGRVLLEVPAGKLEPGEDPFSAAQRELSEEVGAQAAQWTPIGQMMPTPGFCDELQHVYLAQDLTFGEIHPDEDEFLEMARVPFEEMVHRIMSGEITDGKTIAAVLKAKLLLDL